MKKKEKLSKSLQSIYSIIADYYLLVAL